MMSTAISCEEQACIKQFGFGTIARDREMLLSVFDGIDEPMYVARMDTHEILYANDATTRVLGAKAGDTCFVALQGLEEVCEFCTNEKLTEPGSVYVWEFKSPLNDRWYRCIDRAIRWIDGTTVRLEMAIDITDIKEVQEQREKWIGTLSTAIEIIADGIRPN
jgi:PAS domain-containing protein